MGSCGQGFEQKFARFTVGGCSDLVLSLVVVREPLVSLWVTGFVIERSIVLHAVNFAAYVLDLNKARPAVEECALEGHLAGSNLEHLLVLSVGSEFLAISVRGDSVVKQAFTLFGLLLIRDQFMPEEY